MVSAYDGRSDGRSARHQAVQRAQESHRERAKPSAGGSGTSYRASLLGSANLRGRGNAPVQTALLQQMQQTYGNRAVQRLMQRSGQSVAAQRAPLPLQRQAPAAGAAAPAAPAAATTDEQQWEADWDTYKGARHYFNGTGRPSGTPKERYLKLCPLYKARGIPRPLEYMATQVTTASFYQYTTPAHGNLATALKKVEDALKAKGYATAPVLQRPWALNARTTSAGAWSNHADGKAVDMDPDTNPHFLDKSHRKVITLLTGSDIEQANPGAAQGLDSYDALKASSDKFKADYNVAGMTKRIEELKAEETKLAEQEAEIKKELSGVPTGKKATADDRKKAKEIQARLKKKTAEVKGAAKNRTVLEKELKRFQGLDTAVDTSSASVGTLKADIAALEAGLAGADAKQKAALNKQLAAKKAALAKAEKKMAKAEKARSEDTLRNYASTGFLTLSKDLVTAMKDAGFTWGGDWKVHKDIMHFDIK